VPYRDGGGGRQADGERSDVFHPLAQAAHGCQAEVNIDLAIDSYI